MNTSYILYGEDQLSSTWKEQFAKYLDDPERILFTIGGVEIKGLYTVMVLTSKKLMWFCYPPTVFKGPVVWQLPKLEITRILVQASACKIIIYSIWGIIEVKLEESRNTYEFLKDIRRKLESFRSDYLVRRFGTRVVFTNHGFYNFSPKAESMVCVGVNFWNSGTRFSNS